MSLELRARHVGDRVRLADGRVFVLAWCMWPHGTDKGDQKKTPIDGWFAREITEDFGGGEVRGEPEWLAADLAVIEVIDDRVGQLDDGGKRGGDHDPLIAGSAKRPGQGALW